MMLLALAIYPYFLEQGTIGVKHTFNHWFSAIWIVPELFPIVPDFPIIRFDFAQRSASIWVIRSSFILARSLA